MTSKITTRAVIKVISAHKLSLSLSLLLSICMVTDLRRRRNPIVPSDADAISTEPDCVAVLNGGHELTMIG